MFAAPPVIETKVFSRVPVEKTGSRKPIILEGPCFDRDGNLYCVNIYYGQIFKISPDGVAEPFVHYDGEPNGLQMHKDGRIFIADHKDGLLVLDTQSRTISTVIDRPNFERFKGLNDLVFDSRGTLYFTDQGESGLHDPTGRLWRYTAEGRLELLMDNIPSPNGLVLAPDEKILYLAVTRANAVWRVPLPRNGGVGRVGTYIQMSGGVGPDGMAMATDGSLAVAHPGMGCVWLFDPAGRPIAEVRTCQNVMTTNVAFGGADGKTLYITETDAVLVARVDRAGLPLYSHS